MKRKQAERDGMSFVYILLTTWSCNQDQNDYKLPQGHAPGHAPNREMYITTYKLAVILGQYFNNLNK